MKKVFYLFVLAFAAQLFFSCAGGTGSSDSDVGYLSFGSARSALSAFGITASDLSSLTLKGTKDGTTKTLGSWSSGSEIAGTKIAIQAGSWSFELSAKNGNNNFKSTVTTDIKAGQNNTVSFTMSYIGTPSSSTTINNGDYILKNGNVLHQADYNLCDLNELRNNLEGIAFIYGGTTYEIYFQVIKNSYNYASANIPSGGWYIPGYYGAGGQGITAVQSAIDTSLTQAGLGSFTAGEKFWSTESTYSGSHMAVTTNHFGSNATDNANTNVYVVYIKAVN